MFAKTIKTQQSVSNVGCCCCCCFGGGVGRAGFLVLCSKCTKQASIVNELMGVVLLRLPLLPATEKQQLVGADKIRMIEVM